MATPKKTHTTKKVTSKTKAKTRPLTWKFYVVTVGIFIVAVASVVVLALFASGVIGNKTANERLERIKGIYSSLELDDSYIVQGSNVFGKKKTYEWDKNRTYSSTIRYTHADTVSNTIAELDEKIKAAGFEFIDEPYPGLTSTQYHYKSKKGEYIRVTVSSKPYDDASFNATSMNEGIPDEVFNMDKNAGPSNVIIKVNLDDNNE